VIVVRDHPAANFAATTSAVMGSNGTNRQTSSNDR
jgi:hypothetical protein